MKKVPIGISDFKKLIKDEYYYVDKSLFIKEIIDDGAEVILLPRPRRFGKTLNMSMLKYFFELDDGQNRELFTGLNIEKHEDIMQLQGKYPVIYITFKDVKDMSFEKCFNKIQELLSDQYDKFKYLLNNNTLSEVESIYYKKILLRQGSEVDYQSSLKNLSGFLSKYHKKRAVILIDEYDVPIQSGYLNKYYNEIIEFMRNFLSAALKDNEYLEQGVLTGILRVAKESIFSGLNNLDVCTILSYRFSDSFGFTEEETKGTLKIYNLDIKLDEVKEWYNGYIFGKKVIYNPWSILNFVKNHEQSFKPYWINTSSNDLVKLVLTNGGELVKKELENLIQGNTLEKIINEDIVMGDIAKGSENIWSFLLFSGYLKVIYKEYIEGELHCKLQIPNLEVRYLYKQIILGWLKDSINNDEYEIMLKSLINGDIKTFSKIFEKFVLNSFSYFDVGGKSSEKVYHAFVLGLLIALSKDYEVRSNRESGYGRYDVMIIPRDKNKLGIVMEFKKVDEDEDENLEKAAEEALKQIRERDYRQELVDKGIGKIIELGIAFEGKKVLVKRG